VEECGNGLDDDCDGSIDEGCGGCGGPPYDCDSNGSCECNQTCACPNQCQQTVHNNGLGQTFEDCVASGTHNAAQAVKAANAWGQGTPFSASCSFQMNEEQVVCVDSGTQCACWAHTDIGSSYTGAGYVRVSTTGCKCPVSPTCGGDPCFAWD
jgi:hypothetical protein